MLINQKKQVKTRKRDPFFGKVVCTLPQTIYEKRRPHIKLLHVLEHLFSEEDVQKIAALHGYAGESRPPWALYHRKRSGIKLHVALLETPDAEESDRNNRMTTR
jgi:hypothetical protein